LPALPFAAAHQKKKKKAANFDRLQGIANGLRGYSFQFSVLALSKPRSEAAVLINSSLAGDGNCIFC